jgi:hypothetical protein
VALADPSEKRKSPFPAWGIAVIAVFWLPLICCVVLLILDARFAGRPPVQWDRALSLVMTVVAGVGCLVHLFAVLILMASVWKRRPVQRADERMFSSATAFLAYAFLDGWGVSRLGDHPSSVMLWAAIGAASLGVVGAFYFQMQRVFPVLARIRAYRRARRPTGKSDEA